MYRTNCLIKFSELDNYNQGCDPETSRSWSVDIPFQTLDLKALINDISQFVGSSEYQINPCEDDPDRIDWQVMETVEGHKATNGEIEKWKAGKMDLYACTYSAYIYKMESLDIEKELNKGSKSCD